MLVERQCFGPVAVLFVVGGEPVRKSFVDSSDGFALFAARQRRAALAGTVGNYERETRIGRSGPQRGFAAARMPDDADVAAVNVPIGSQIIERATGAPRPRRQRAPGIGRARFALFARRLEKRVDAVFKTIVFVVGIERARQKRRRAIARARSALRPAKTRFSRRASDRDWLRHDAKSTTSWAPVGAARWS